MINRRNFNLTAVAGLGAVTTLSSGAAQAAMKPKTSLNVIYMNHEGAKFDLQYYKDKHIPLAMKVMKATSVTLVEGVANGDAPPPVVMIAYFEFASPEALKAAMADPKMGDVRADVANVTDIKPTVMVGRTL
jgi:uncharacterized protein (TIGR02118 family)